MADETKPMDVTPEQQAIRAGGKGLNLVQKLALIRRDLKNIEKEGHNSFQNYDYLRAEDIAGKMGDRLAAMNVIVARRNLQFVQDNITIKKENGDERTDVHVIVTLDYVFIDGDAWLRDTDNLHVTNDEITVASIGEGRDSGDKAVAKAMTNALKYALTQPLMMRVGDDPEADADHDKPETRKVAQNGSNASKKPSTDDRDAELQALVREARQRIGKDLGDKWLKAAVEGLGVTSKTITLAQIRTLFERTLTLTRPAGDTATEDPDLNW